MRQKNWGEKNKKEKEEWVFQVQDGALMIDGISETMQQQEAAEFECATTQVQMHRIWKIQRLLFVSCHVT